MVKRSPDFIDISYGEHRRQAIDLWLTSGATPSPLFVFIHGGGFRGGDKEHIPETLLEGCLGGGISVAAINYRLSHHAPYPAPMLDGVRAVQYLRSRAREWNLDADRFACGGGSAGGGISLWIGFHPDFADSESSDPVKRESSRLTCMACTATQSSYDPNFIRQIIPGEAYLESALQVLFRVWQEDFDTPEAKRKFTDGSAITHVTAKSPPVQLTYMIPKLPFDETLTMGAGIHHPRFGEVLKEKMDKLGVHCELIYREDLETRLSRTGVDGVQSKDEAIRQSMFRENVRFLRANFGV